VHAASWTVAADGPISAKTGTRAQIDRSKEGICG
jgi:hypothetical protein